MKDLLVKPGAIKTILYWVTTVLTAFILLSGGWWLMFNSQFTAVQNASLSLPGYFWQILGFYKLLGGIAVLLPRFPLMKEWAYAGIAFNLSGACACRVLTGDSAGHIVAPLVVFGLAMIS